MRYHAAGLWGIAGVLALLVEAVYRLLPLARAVIGVKLSALELAVLVGWVVVGGYAEGYRGFHRQFSPRVVARALHLSQHRRLLFVLLAPLYCMGLIHATRKRLVTSWVLTLSIVMVVLLVRQLAHPWRGIVDTGVVVGLSWGIASIASFTVQAFLGKPMPVPPDVPTP